MVPRHGDDNHNPYIVYAGNVSLLWMRRDAAANGLVFNPEESAWDIEIEECLSAFLSILTRASLTFTLIRQ